LLPARHLILITPMIYAAILFLLHEWIKNGSAKNCFFHSPTTLKKTVLTNKWNRFGWSYHNCHFVHLRLCYLQNIKSSLQTLDMWQFRFYCINESRMVLQKITISISLLVWKRNCAHKKTKQIWLVIPLSDILSISDFVTCKTFNLHYSHQTCGNSVSTA